MFKFTFILFFLHNLLIAQNSYFAPNDCNYPATSLDEKGGFKDLIIGADLSNFLHMTENGECPFSLDLNLPISLISFNCKTFAKFGFKIKHVQKKYLYNKYTLFGEQPSEIILFFYEDKLKIIYIKFSYMQNIISNFGEIFDCKNCISKYYGSTGNYNEYLYLRGYNISLIGHDYNLTDLDFILFFDEKKLLKLVNELKNANKSDY